EIKETINCYHDILFGYHDIPPLKEEPKFNIARDIMISSSGYCDIAFVYLTHQSHKACVGPILAPKSHQNTLQSSQKLLRRETHFSLVLAKSSRRLVDGDVDKLKSLDKGLNRNKLD
ncbi:hypothetical protein J1N35_000977, partial [Gossypium stocksii]